MEDIDRDIYFQDVKLQLDAKVWGEEYNRHNPPKKVQQYKRWKMASINIKVLITSFQSYQWMRCNLCVTKGVGIGGVIRERQVILHSAPMVVKRQRWEGLCVMQAAIAAELHNIGEKHICSMVLWHREL